MRKKSQASIEFMFFVGMAFVLLAAYLIISYNYLNLTFKRKDIVSALDLLEEIRNEINLAARVENGYTRVITLPGKINNQEYNLSINKREISIRFNEVDYARLLSTNVTPAGPNPSVPPIMNPGDKMVIQKINDKVYVSLACPNNGAEACDKNSVVSSCSDMEIDNPEFGCAVKCVNNAWLVKNYCADSCLLDGQDPFIGGGNPPEYYIPGLILAYSFDEGSGTNVIDYSSINSPNPGTLIGGVTRVPGQTNFGDALHFDGGSSYVDIINDLDVNEFTISLLMSPESSIPNDCRSIIMKMNDYGIEMCDGFIEGKVGDGNSWLATAPSTYQFSYPNSWGSWYHIALTYDGSALKLYMDNDPFIQADVPGTHVSTNNDLRIGYDGNTGYFYGWLDNVRIYNRALTQPEIQIIMNRPVQPETPPPPNYLLIEGNLAKCPGIPN